MPFHRLAQALQSWEHLQDLLVPVPHLGQVIAEVVKKEQPLALPPEVKAQLHQEVVYARKFVGYVVNLIPPTNRICTIISKLEYNPSEMYLSAQIFIKF